MRATLCVALVIGACVAVSVSVSARENVIASEFRLRRARHRASAVERARMSAALGTSDSNLNATGGHYGIDISGATCDGSSWVSDKEFPCFKDKGVSTAIVESHNGGLGPTKAIKHCTDAAHSAGYERVDVYSFWCPNCGGNTPAKAKMEAHVRGLKSQGVNFDTIWLDIETCSGCWSDAGTNAKFIRDLAEGAAAASAKVGIYTNANEWSAVVGDNKDFKGFPLWYAHYDDRASFDDFSPFGGWDKPFMKQYNDQSTVGCYSGVDMDWRP